MSRERSKHYISEGADDNPYHGIHFSCRSGRFNTPHGSFDTLDEAVAAKYKAKEQAQRESQPEVYA